MAFLNSKEWKTMRTSILERDGCCVLCGSKEKLIVHHILYRRGFVQYSLEPLNLITVCQSCHYRIHSGVYGLLLSEYLRLHRPEQLEWILAHIQKKLFNRG